MEAVNVHYTIKLSDMTETFSYQFAPETYELIQNKVPDAPAWTKLDYNKCSHCPLSSDVHPNCPLALQLNELISKFHDTRSIDDADVEVASDTRRVIQKTSLQYAIGSILEVLYPSCGCPKTRMMRPLSRFHVPSGAEDENVYRIASMYLMAQYFRNQTSNGGDFGFDGLVTFYADMNILNKAIASRLKGATRSDSVKNAIALMDMYSTLVPLMLEDGLLELRGFFVDLLPEDGVGKMPTAKSNYLDRIKVAKLEITPLEEQPSNDEPDWLKNVRKNNPPHPEPKESDIKRETATKEKQAIDQILKQSTLSLALEPEEDEKEKPKTGKAIFKLPDD